MDRQSRNEWAEIIAVVLTVACLAIAWLLHTRAQPPTAAGMRDYRTEGELVFAAKDAAGNPITDLAVIGKVHGHNLHLKAYPLDGMREDAWVITLTAFLEWGEPYSEGGDLRPQAAPSQARGSEPKAAINDDAWSMQVERPDGRYRLVYTFTAKPGAREPLYLDLQKEGPRLRSRAGVTLELFPRITGAASEHRLAARGDRELVGCSGPDCPETLPLLYRYTTPGAFEAAQMQATAAGVLFGIGGGGVAALVAAGLSRWVKAGDTSPPRPPKPRSGQRKLLRRPRP